MYTIKALVDGKYYTLHNPKVKELTVGDPYFETGDNLNGQAEFTIFPEHPYYSKVKKLTTDIIFYRDNKPEFYGRVLYDDEDFNGSKKVFVEGELAFFCDSIQRPKVYHNTSVKAYLQDIINIHNSQVEERKQFTLGLVTVTDSNDSLYRYSNWEDTRKILKEKLTSRLGGHLVIRHENGLRILDYLSDDTYYRKNPQKIEFGKNLLDFAKNMDASDLATCIIPLGAKLEENEQDESLGQIKEQRITIASINGGVDYVTDDKAVAEYGKIYKTVIFDNVKVPSNLKKKGEEYLKTAQFEKMVLELKAIDLNFVNEGNQELRVGDKIRCISAPNGMDKEFPLTKKRIYITQFKKNTVTLGDESNDKSYTSSNRQESAQIEEEIQKIPSKSEILEEALKDAQDLINQQAKNGHAIHVPEEFIVADDEEYKTQARNLWRWGLGGLAHYSHGYDGPIDGIALTMDGKINGNMLLANSVTAQSIDIGYRTEVENTITESFTNSKQEAIQAAKDYANGIKNSVNQEIQDITDIVLEMDSQLDYIASDGIITEAEKAAINKILLTIQKEKKEADEKYNELYQNAHLTGSAKNNLYSKYNVVYGTSSTSKYNVLIQKISDILSSTTAIQIQSNLSVYKTAYTAYGTALAEYQRAIEEAANAIAKEYAIEQATKAEENAQQYTDNTVRVAKETIETSISNLQNKINLSVSSVKEVASRKNYVKNGEQETLAKSAFSVSGSATVTEAEYMNMKCLKIEFYGSGGVTIEQYLGEPEEGDYVISVATAYPSSNQRPSYIGYGFSGNRTNVYYSNYKPEEFQVLSRTVRITKATKYVSVYVYGYSGNICYITNIRALRDMQELLDDLDARMQVEIGKVSATVENVYENSLYNYCINGNFSKGSTGFEGWTTSDAYQITKVTYNSKTCAKIVNTSFLHYLKWRQQPFSKSGPIRVRFKAACASGYENTARIKVKIDGKTFYTTVGELSTSWKIFEFNSSATTPYFETYIYNDIEYATVYITDVEILGYYSGYSLSQVSVLKDSIQAEVTRAEGAEAKLQSSININANNITNSVKKGEFGSYVTQYYDRVITAFNNSSKYVQISAGEIGIYDYGVTTSKKRTVFDENGNHFWRDGYEIGKIGTNYYSGNSSLRGLVFDLEYQGAYMTWAVKKTSSASSYTMMWTYANRTVGGYTAGRLHAGCDIDMHNYYLRNVQFEGGGITGTLNFVQIKAMDRDGTVATWVNGCKLEFKNGILISGTWN